MERFDGEAPINARIKIDYSKNKPKVSFSYPDKKNQFKGSMFYPLVAGWLIINLPISIYLTWMEYNKMIFYLYVIGLFSLIYFPFKKKWDKLYPDFQAFTESKKIAILKSEDVKENFDKNIKYKYYIEIPVFNNIVCDFNAIKDFSKYMKEFEIREHKFLYIKKRIFRRRNKKKRRKKMFLKKNEWLWYARWYFSKKPMEGKMEVVFK